MGELMAGADSRLISAKFTAAARSYDREAGVQRHVAEEVMSLLDGTGAVSPILEIGCGTGWMTNLLRGRFPEAELHALDISPSMIGAAKARLGGGCAVRWHVGDARCWDTSSRFRLVIGSSALHWLAPLGQTLQHLAFLTRPGAMLVFGVMVRGTLAELRQARQCVAPEKSSPDRLPTTREVTDGLLSAGTCVEASRTVEVRSTHSNAWDFLRAIHAQGVTGGFYGAGAVLNRHELDQLVRHYDRHFRTADGRVFATYRVLYVRARRVPNEEPC